MTSVVMTGRRMKSSEMFMPPLLLLRWRAALVCPTSTRAPAVRRSWPSVTTVSPASRPFSITVSSSRDRPTVDGPLLDRLVALDDEDVRALLAGLHGLARESRRAFGCSVSVRTTFTNWPGQRRRSSFANGRLQPDGARRGVDGVVHERQLARFRRAAAVAG